MCLCDIHAAAVLLLVPPAVMHQHRRYLTRADVSSAVHIYLYIRPVLLMLSIKVVQKTRTKIITNYNLYIQYSLSKRIIIFLITRHTFFISVLYNVRTLNCMALYCTAVYRLGYKSYMHIVSNLPYTIPDSL